MSSIIWYISHFCGDTGTSFWMKFNISSVSKNTGCNCFSFWSCFNGRECVGIVLRYEWLCNVLKEVLEKACGIYKRVGKTNTAGLVVYETYKFSWEFYCTLILFISVQTTHFVSRRVSMQASGTRTPQKD